MTTHYWRSIIRLLVFQLDILGVLLSSAGFTLLMLALSFVGNRFSWNSASFIALFVLSPIFVLLFCVYDFKFLPYLNRRFDNLQARPLLLWSIASDWGVWSSSIVSLFSCFAYSLQTVFLVQYYQMVHNKGPMLASIHLWEFSVPASISTVIMGLLNSQYGTIKPFMLFGVVCGIVGSGLLCMLTGSLPYYSPSATLCFLVWRSAAFSRQAY